MKTLEEIEAALSAPLKKEDIREVNKQEYVSGGDVILNLNNDVGPLGWEDELVSIDVEEPRLERREFVDKRTGAVEEKEGWTCSAHAVVRLTIHLPGGGKRCHDGAGADTSEMQPFPHMASKNAYKGAETDALKRAAVKLGPRYGLALRFKDRDDDREELGMVERDPKVEAALAKAREAQAAREAKAKEAAAAASPEGKKKAFEAAALEVHDLLVRIVDESKRASALTAIGCVTTLEGVAAVRKKIVKTLETQDARQPVPATIPATAGQALAEVLAKQNATAGAPSPEPSPVGAVSTGSTTEAAEPSPALATPFGGEDGRQAGLWEQPEAVEKLPLVVGPDILGVYADRMTPVINGDRRPLDAPAPEWERGGPSPERETVVLAAKKDGTPLVAEIVTAPDPSPATSPQPSATPSVATDSPPSPDASSTCSSPTSESPEQPASSPSTPAPLPTSSDELAADLASQPDQRTPQPSVPGHGTVYGAKADEVRAQMKRVTPSDKEEAVRETNEANFDAGATMGTGMHVALALMQGKVIDGAVSKMLASGITLDLRLPPDPSVDELLAVEWACNGGTARELCLLKASDPVPVPLRDAVVARCKELLDRAELGALWNALGMPGKGQLPNAYQLRLLAWVTGARVAKRAKK